MPAYQATPRRVSAPDFQNSDSTVYHHRATADSVNEKREQHPVFVFVSSHQGDTRTQKPTNNTTDPDSN